MSCVMTKIIKLKDRMRFSMPFNLSFMDSLVKVGFSYIYVCNQ